MTRPRVNSVMSILDGNHIAADFPSRDIVAFSLGILVTLSCGLQGVGWHCDL